MSEKPNDGGPAFPQSIDENGNILGNVWKGAGGMSLLDWFAGQAMAGNLAASAHPESCGYTVKQARGLAEFSYTIAEAMLAEKKRLEAGE